MLYNELPIPFPWYDKLEKQNRYNENTGGVCDYQLITPADALLPFQFYRQTPGGVMPTVWEVFEINSQVLVANISANIPLLTRFVKEGREYFTYFGQALTGLALPAGNFYSRLTFPGGTFYYSEMFYVPEGLFYIATDTNIDYLKITWYHKGDLRPIFYNDLDGSGLPKFRNSIYLDTFVHASEPEITEDGTRDGNDELIPTFQKVVIPYRITVMVPDFLKKALCLLPIHNVVSLRTKHGVREGVLESVKVNSALEVSGALSVVDILFTSEIAIVAKGCADNMS
jgi:hypothetical protein